MMDKRAVYRYKSPGGCIGTALLVQMRDGMLCFFDTDRGHMLRGKLLEEEEDSFSFEAESGLTGIWHFEKLTIETFRREHWKHVADGALIGEICGTTQDLYQWYRNNFKID